MTLNERVRIIELRSLGMSFPQIEAETGVSRATAAGKCTATLILKHLALEGPQSSMTVIKDTLPGYLMRILMRQVESFYMNSDLMLAYNSRPLPAQPATAGFSCSTQAMDRTSQ